ncbi:molybdopterin cofactor-binding domain-containing protein [Sphingomonas sp. DT-51]|uniref:xanthine dehydrogenase family protein molybdopterin-binding subunit n=1 Tax=Sphingomonas sp. DT-51 TaxID=3396165 RepID=UPI003F1BD581
MTFAAPGRRAVLAAALAIPGAYFLNFTTSAASGDTGSDVLVEHLLRITPDDEIVITSPVAEIGQGTSTAYAMLVGDALDADWERIRIELAPVGKEYYNPRFFSQLTGASTGTSAFHAGFTKAGATARTALMLAAARRWNVDVASVNTDQGRVIGPGGRSLRFGELTAIASRMPAPQTLIDRTDDRPRFVGRRMLRLDLPSKVDGSARYAIDVQLPGMLSAAVACAPVFGGRLASDSRAEVLKIPGIKGVVDLPNGVAVVADRWWTARRALETLAPVWASTPNDGVNDAAISRQFDRDLAARPGAVVDRIGQGAEALDHAAKVVRRRYEVPYLAHATMEPMSCVAQVSGARCDFWTGSQHPQNARDAVAKLLGLLAERVTYHPVIAGGGFGRRQETDVAQQAALIASKFPGVPVKLIWTREEDVAHDFYRPAGVSELSAGISDGQFETYVHRQATPSILPRLYPVVMKEYDEVVTDAIQSPYGFANREARWVRSETHVPAGMWRSVGSSHTVFAIESFVDEVSHELTIDPLEMRRGLLRNSPRELAALNRVAELSGWPGKDSGSALGLSISHKRDDCLAAQVARVRIKDGQPVVDRLWTVADPGRAVNRDAVIAQLEGAAIWGLTSALFGQVSIDQGRVQESNFHDYRMVRLSEAPVFRTELLENGEIEGTGEGGSPNVAPAVCNAIFRLTGRRIRELPILKHFA